MGVASRKEGKNSLSAKGGKSVRMGFMERALPVTAVITAITLWVIPLGSSGTAIADEVYLKNGDRITGKIIKMDLHKLLYKTPYGELTINWQDVSTISTDHPVRVVLSDERSLEGTPRAAAEGSTNLMVVDGEEPILIKLAEVKSINPKPERALDVKTRVNFALKLERGNTDTDNYHLDWEFIARYVKKNRLWIHAEFDQESDKGEKISNSALGLVKYDRFLSEQWYVWGEGLIEFDEFKDLNLRTAYSGGAGYQIFETPTTNLLVQAGGGWVFEDYEGDESDRDFPAAIWSLNYDQWLFRKFTQFFHRQLLYIGLEDVENSFLKTRTGFRFPLYKGFATTLQWNLDWDDSPGPDIDEADHTFLVSVGYSYNY